MDISSEDLDTFRINGGRLLPEPQQHLVKGVKNIAATLWEAMSLAQYKIETSDPRSLALAKTKLEEAVMWAVKGLTA